jgi:hypothetical protein
VYRRVHSEFASALPPGRASVASVTYPDQITTGSGGPVRGAALDSACIEIQRIGC